MAIKYNNKLTYGYGFNITAQGPVDSRTVVEKVSDLTSVWGSNAPAYQGLVVSVLEDGNLYILTASDPKVADNWKVVGSGAGSLAVENFSFTEGENPTIIEAENIGQIIYVTTGSEDYPAGPYIVTGVGSVSKLVFSDAVSEIQTDVEGLKSADQALQKAIDDEVAARGTAVSEVSNAVQQLSTTVSGKVGQTEFNALEGRVGTAESAITVVEGRVDTLETKVEALSSATHFIGVKESLPADGANGDIVVVGTKEYIYDESQDTKWIELGDTTAESQAISAVEVRVGSLESLVGSSENGLIKDVATNASAISVLEGKVDTLEKVDHPTKDQVVVVEGKVATLETDVVGLKSADEAIIARVATLEAVEHPTLKQVTDLEGSVSTVVSDLSSLTDKVSGLETTTGNLGTQIGAINESLSEYKIKDVDVTSSHGVSLTSAGDKVGVSVDIDVLSAAVIAKHEVTSDEVTTTAQVGTLDAGVSVQTALENLDSRIKAAVSGGVTAVGAGLGIAVNADDPNNPSVSVKIKTGSAIVADADGIDLAWSQF